MGPTLVSYVGVLLVVSLVYFVNEGTQSIVPAALQGHALCPKILVRLAQHHRIDA